MSGMFPDLTDEQLRARILAGQLQIQANEAQGSLLAFTQFMNPSADDPLKSTYSVQPHHRVIAECLQDVESGKLLAEKGIRFVCISVGPQKGKLVADETPVLSGRGWITHGQLRCGDVVFGPDGQPCVVLAISEPAQASLRVSFTDGSAVDVHPMHEWTVFDKQKHGQRTIETQWLLEQQLWLQKGGMRRETGRKAEARFAVAPPARVQMPEVDLPIEPYALGAWLGDGSSDKPCITHAAQDIAVADAVSENYPRGPVCVHKTTGVLTTYFTGDAPRGGGGPIKSAFRTALERAGVFRNKHIPAAYFVTSLRQRLELLAGLVDTDGCVHVRTNRWGFANANKRLVDDVARLIATLGWRATLAEYQPVTSSSGIVGKQIVWQVTFSPDIFIPTRLPRKQVARPNALRRMRGIARIEQIKPKPGRCIQVSRSDGLYCVGDSLIPTHNSTLVSHHFPPWLVGRNPKRNFMFGTYSDSFAWEWGDKVRAVMQSPRYPMVFPKVRLRKGSKAKDHMVTEPGGQVNFVGRGGAGAGKPADIFVIDDPVKNAEEARSLTIRDATWEWFTRVVFKRMHGQSVCFIITTRWHLDDIVGRLTDKNNPKYQESVAKATLLINLPSIVDDPALAEILKVPVGGSIWEERFPLVLLELGRDLDPNGFSALEMGRPTPPEGSFFKRFQIHTYNSPDKLPKNLRMYGAADLALTPEIQADSSVVGNAGVDENDNLWILPDLFWDKVAADASAEWLINYCLTYGWLQFFGEKGQIARAIGPFLAKDALKRGAMAVVAPELFPTTGNKGARCLSIRAYMGQGKVFFPSFAPWWPRAEDQMLNFTGSGEDLEDDLCDMLGLLGQGLNLQIKAAAPPKEPDNVIRVGTFAWVKAQHNRERKQEEIQRRMRAL